MGAARTFKACVPLPHALRGHCSRSDLCLLDDIALFTDAQREAVVAAYPRFGDFKNNFCSAILSSAWAS
jgi:hypothetical protein